MKRKFENSLGQEMPPLEDIDSDLEEIDFADFLQEPIVEKIVQQNKTEKEENLKNLGF